MARPSPAALKTERLLNLVIALLYTRQPMSKNRIRTAVPQYAESTDEAFDRMFERDKDELRDLGIPLRTEVVDPLFDDETGYRIDKREYALPEISFEPDELAVIGVASRAWSQASLAGPAAQALRKLEASGLTRDTNSVAGIEPLLQTSEPSFDAARDAVVARREVTFNYRGGSGAGTGAGGGTGSGAGDGAGASERHLQPWALTSWHGRWYLTGFDLDRQAPRVFRLDRVEGKVRASGRPGAYEVPADHDPRAMITRSTTEEPGELRARVALRLGSGHQLRRRGELLPERGPHGWDVVAVNSGSVRALAEEIAGLGPDAIALEPPDLVEAVVSTLRAVRDAHQPSTDGDSSHTHESTDGGN